MILNDDKKARDPHLYRYLLRYTNDDDSGKMREIYEIIDKYRVLSNLTWREFLYLSIAEYVKEDNPDLSDAIIDGLKSLRKVGRPAGSSVKQKLYRMGIDPSTIEKDV